MPFLFCFVTCWFWKTPLEPSELTIWHTTEADDCPSPRIHQLLRVPRYSEGLMSPSLIEDWLLAGPVLCRLSAGNHSSCEIMVAMVVVKREYFAIFSQSSCSCTLFSPSSAVLHDAFCNLMFFTSFPGFLGGGALVRWILVFSYIISSHAVSKHNVPQWKGGCICSRRKEPSRQ